MLKAKNFTIMIKIFICFVIGTVVVNIFKNRAFTKSQIRVKASYS